MKRIITLVLSFILLFTCFTVTASAKEVDKNNLNVEETVIQLYNSRGELIGEFESEDELNNYYNKTKINYATKRDIIKLIKRLAEEIVLEILVEGINDGWAFLNEMQITIPNLEVGQIAVVVSKDGNISNPYPPNSYQAKIWKDINFVIEVRKE